MGAKLVRDRIGELSWRYEQAKAGLRPVRDRAEHLRLLRMKLLEEVGELVSAETENEQLDEIVDVFEVLLAWLQVAPAEPWVGEHLAWLIAAADEKHAERGGFEVGTAWEGTASL